MQRRINDMFDHIVNKGLIMSQVRGATHAQQMMRKAGLPNSIIQRVLSDPQKIRRFDWK